MNLKGKDFLTLVDFTKDEILYLLDFAQEIKKDTKSGHFLPILQNKNLALIFSKPSLRTRVSFEIGMRQLGGNSLTLKQDEINLGIRETIADTARVLSRYANCVMIRTFAHRDVEEFAKYSTVPTINGLTDDCHPCQIMADLLTIKEHFSKLEGLKLTYVGDGNNVANSLLAGCALVGMDITIACPKGYEPMEKFLNFAKNTAKKSGSKVEILNDPISAVSGANIIYTDVWASMGQESEAQARKEIFKPYQINDKLCDNAADDCIVLHCLPAHREEEITHSVLEKHAKSIFEQAENRMHAQKAILASIIG